MTVERGPREENIGRLLGGKYEVARLIGAGSMGAVYEGVHVELGKRVAIKLVHPQFCNSPEIVGRFRREARAASAIESEHVAQIFDFGRDDQLGLYMVIEFLDGEDVEARLARQQRIAVPEAVQIAWQVARGLSRAHDAGVVHRDLKPANVFLTERDDGALLAKILDFGISKLEPAKWARATGSEGGAEATLTARGTTLGTPQYMSPEQCQGKDGIDGRTDVWSLCAVLYEMLAGQPAFSDSGGFIVVMQRIVSTDAAPLAKRAPWVPEALARVVDGGLVRSRSKRIPSAAVLAERLLQAYPQADGRLGAPEPAPPTEPLGYVSEDAPPPSGAEDGVEVFVRTGELLAPIARVRRR